ncbi:hypothetical protein MNBD_GAMMA25-181 [hydrothermal vent metagenome]|uniref:Uncharacterized protein n=1 Tax=hydrothermal vent metagenome TaxID=652676 RepID=A0A3B1BSM9_9ZZZZ
MFTPRHRRWYLADVVSAVFSTSSETGTLEEERIRLTKEQADKTAIENAKLRGELVPLDDMGTAWLAMTSAFRASMLSIPGKLAPILAAETDRHRVRQILEAEIEEALAELSQTRITIAGGPDDSAT